MTTNDELAARDAEIAALNQKLSDFEYAADNNHRAWEAAQAEIAALKQQLADEETYWEEEHAKANRFFSAFQKVLRYHYEHILWFGYTIDRPAIQRKFVEWTKSDKNKIKEYNPEEWFTIFGLEEGDWERKPKDADLADADPAQEGE